MVNEIQEEKKGNIVNYVLNFQALGGAEDDANRDVRRSTESIISAVSISICVLSTVSLALCC